ncbi:unnamed protein product [Chironomus riparius]|uniref:Uncharacterized protein n=1 Tax=Chironomus riparius TaxID=315576 RepID=A0A9N9WTN5_9DIPT|nr:unnamed protein product [Chironomus riparius]
MNYRVIYRVAIIIIIIRLLPSFHFCCRLLLL